jgi:hypothetical protein
MRMRAVRTVAMVVAALVALAVVVSLMSGRGDGDNGADCGPASPTALATIASGARLAFEPLTLSDGQATDATITSAVGEQQDGILVAARTPSGTGVWVMDLDAYGSDNGLVYAVNGPAMSTTIWGAETNFMPVALDDVTAVEACIG